MPGKLLKRLIVELSNSKGVHEALRTK